jgi:hypothetical protein
VRAAIARAARATGVDFDYLLAQAKLESSLDPSARASTSSAAGLYQFTRGTWLETLDKHGASHGLDWAGAAIDGGRVTDPGLHTQIMALRMDPNASALMAAELASDNRAELTGVLGREPDPAELYLAHFLGSAGAAQFLGALRTDPGQSAAALLPKAAAANRTIFYDGGAPRSVAGVMDLMRRKVAGAMEGTATPVWPMPSGAWAVQDAPAGAFPAAAVQPAPGFAGGPIAREWQAARLSAPPAESPGEAPARASMADTLRSTFAATGAGGRAAMPSAVQAAYDQLRRFDL